MLFYRNRPSLKNVSFVGHEKNVLYSKLVNNPFNETKWRKSARDREDWVKGKKSREKYCEMKDKVEENKSNLMTGSGHWHGHLQAAFVPDAHHFCLLHL